MDKPETADTIFIRQTKQFTSNESKTVTETRKAKKEAKRLESQIRARQATQKHARTVASLLERMQTAAAELSEREDLNWGHAAQTQEALRLTVEAAFTLGVLSSDETCELGFPC